jgi:hypothetical protein
MYISVCLWLHFKWRISYVTEQMLVKVLILIPTKVKVEIKVQFRFLKVHESMTCDTLHQHHEAHYSIFLKSLNCQLQILLELPRIRWQITQLQAISKKVQLFPNLRTFSLRTEWQGIVPQGLSPRLDPELVIYHLCLWYITSSGPKLYCADE